MPWVRFTGNYDFTPARQRGVTLAYLAGMERNVTRECARKAKDKGRAQTIPAPGTRAAAAAVIAAGES
jgi:hypothetical protein